MICFFISITSPVQNSVIHVSFFFLVPPDKPKDEQADSFAEKMASNIIKNLQIEISDIHVRYEDHFTNPQNPFAVGATLKNMSFLVSYFA